MVDRLQISGLVHFTRGEKAEIAVVVGALIIGMYLRFHNLGLPPLWCDEAFYATDVYHFESRQEFLPAAIGHILGVGNELAARIPFAVAGMLTIAAVYVVNPSKYTAWLSLVVATFPLFVFYDRMCRPYAMAGLFVVLAWRWKWFYYAAVLCTPTSLMGVNVLKIRKDWKFYCALAIVAVVIFEVWNLTSNAGRADGDLIALLSGVPRYWYVPILAGMMYVAWYAMQPRFEKRFAVYRALCLAASVVFLSQSWEIPDFSVGPLKRWYTPLIYYCNWRGIRPVDLSTTYEQITGYYTGVRAPALRVYERQRIDSLLKTKDTLYIGVDGNLEYMKGFFVESYFDPYREFLANGGVMVLRGVKGRDGQFAVDVVQLNP